MAKRRSGRKTKPSNNKTAGWQSSDTGGAVWVWVIERVGSLGCPPETVASTTQPWISGRRQMDRWKTVITEQG